MWHSSGGCGLGYSPAPTYSGSVPSDAVLSDAVLSDAVLSDAVLSDAVLEARNKATGPRNDMHADRRPQLYGRVTA
jgi:hypothetical protein